MVTRLSAADAMALRTQTSTPPAHTVVVIILEACDHFSHARLHRLVASSLPELARFRSRLVSKPLGMGQPVWAEIDDYDATRNIQRASVAAPGGRRELADLVTLLSAEAQDWRRSLWRAWTIDGLAGGRWALAVQMSPVLTDGGYGVASVWKRLLTRGPNGSAGTLRTETSLGSVPSVGELVTDTVSEIIENHIMGVRLVAEAVTGVMQSLLRRPRETPGPPVDQHATSSMSGPVPHTVFNAPLTKRRSMAFASIPLTDLKTVRNAFGGSTANVFLAACAMSMRAWMQKYDVVPDDPLVMKVPLSLPAGDAAEAGKSLTTGQVRVPVQLADPVQVLTNLYTAAERLNIAHDFCHEKTDRTADPADALSLLPPLVAHAGRRVCTELGLSRRRAPSYDGSVSFTSGGPARAYCAGAEVIGMHIAEPLVDGCGLHISVTSHADVMDLCLCACPDNVPRVDEIATGIVKAVNTLLVAAAQSPRGTGRSVVTEMTSHATRHSHSG
jgi:diacylglycerol O-acyltransferase